MSNLTFEENDTKMEFIKNPWDSKAFDRTCYDLKVQLGRMPPSRSSALGFIEQSNLQTLTCRAESTDYELRQFIQYLGFIHVELQLNCHLVLSEKLAPSRQMGVLRPATENDRIRVEEIASEIFLNTRFRYVPTLPTYKISARFANWASQLQDEHPEFAYVLEDNDKVIGFFYSKPTKNDNELYAALGGVSNDCRGPYGFYLYPAVMKAYYDTGVRIVVSAIAADNLGALNLWASLGTRFPRAVDFFMWNSVT